MTKVSNGQPPFINDLVVHDLNEIQFIMAVSLAIKKGLDHYLLGVVIVITGRAFGGICWSQLC